MVFGGNFARCPFLRAKRVECTGLGDVFVRYLWFSYWAPTFTARPDLVPLSRSLANKIPHWRPPGARFVPISVGASGSRAATESNLQTARHTPQSELRFGFPPPGS